jgi:hypothetical protein
LKQIQTPANPTLQHIPHPQNPTSRNQNFQRLKSKNSYTSIRKRLIEVADAHLKNRVFDPNSKDFSRTLSGVVSSGLFEVKQMYNQDTDNEVKIRLLKLI